MLRSESVDVQASVACRVALLSLPPTAYNAATNTEPAHRKYRKIGTLASDRSMPNVTTSSRYPEQNGRRGKTFRLIATFSR
jgi:hypothetical protein